MATASASIIPPPLTAEADTYAVNQQSLDITPIISQPSDAPSDSEKLETRPPAVLEPPLFINSIAELKDLSSAISAFHQCYEDLHNHLDSIKAAILGKLPSETPHMAELAPETPHVAQLTPETPHTTQLTPETPRATKLNPETPRATQLNQSSSTKPNVLEETVFDKQQKKEQNPLKSELEELCRTMHSRGLRKYLAAHLSNLPMLREEVPKALKQAPKPLKLVLECLGKFYLQGSKAFSRSSPMIPAREASILMLECFLMMMGMDNSDEKDNRLLDIEKAVKGEADNAALAWRKRLVSEGGLAKACQIDARGLLLFVACFGIPAVFKVEDIRDLVIAGNVREIVGVLKNSRVLMSKLPEIVEGLMRRKMEVDAVDIIYTFGFEERFNPQTVLISFLREAKETWKKPKKGSQGPAAALNDANKKQLAALKSIRKCLERHKIDPEKLLPGWQISEKITTLEKEITEFDRKSGEKAAHKRKSNETETSKKPKAQEAKRPRYVGHGPQQQNAAAVHIDSRRNLLDSGFPHHANSYSASQAVVYGGPGAGLLPPGVDAGISASHGSVHPTYVGVHERLLVDAAGQVMNHGTHPYVWHRNPTINERFAGQPSSVGLTSLYRAPTSVEGFAGNATSIAHGSQGSASDLYQFADSVAESELYPGGVPRSVPTAVPTAVPAHHSSYLYQV